MFFAEAFLETVSGFINLNKPSGMSSAAVVGKIKKIVQQPCGHMGTLDPMASGVLPVAVGNASRLFQYLLNKEKVYRAVFRFGVETDTLDACGTIVREGERVPDVREIQEHLSEMIGEIDQIPPAYSAKSVGGVRAYRLARQGKAVLLDAKRVHIRSFTLTGQISQDSYEFLIRCGGGTYIRSLGRDLAASCNTVAVMTSLIREKSGYFCLQNSNELTAVTSENWKELLIAPDLVFEMPKINFDGEEARKLRNGLALPFSEKDGEYKLYLDDEFYGIAQSCSHQVRAKVKLI